MKTNTAYNNMMIKRNLNNLTEIFGNKVSIQNVLISNNNMVKINIPGQKVLIINEIKELEKVYDILSKHIYEVEVARLCNSGIKRNRFNDVYDTRNILLINQFTKKIMTRLSDDLLNISQAKDLITEFMDDKLAVYRIVADPELTCSVKPSSKIVDNKLSKIALMLAKENNDPKYYELCRLGGISN